MESKFVIRLLDADGQLLAWNTEIAVAHPQGGGHSCVFWPANGKYGTTAFVVEQAGLATRISVHWCDLDLARVSPVIEPLAVEPGHVLQFKWLEPVWLVAGMKDVPLPPVTVRQPVLVSVPKGAIVPSGSESALHRVGV